MGGSTERLSVYSASAGSGKTYTIAYQFISMMLLGNAYRDILAVTFTNKASGEMKTRIVKYLYLISNADELKGKDRSDIEGFILKIKGKTGLERNEIVKRSKNFFEAVLHDYSFFSVFTIDSFFQRIIRNLTYELGMQQNYELELQVDIVISQLVDDLMLLAETDSELNDSIVELIESNVELNDKWSPKKKIKEFINEAINSDYNGYPEGFVLDAYKKELKGKLQEYSKNFSKCISDIKSILENDASKSAKAYSWLEKFNGHKLDSRFQMQIIDEWFAGQKNKSEKFLSRSWFKKGASQTIVDKVEGIVVDFERDNSFEDYYTAHVICDTLGLVKLLEKATCLLHENLERDSMFLISDVPAMLSSIIESFRDDNGQVSVMPFVFEKVGTKYLHFLIDEFQDTSDKQWNIFKTMLEDSLSQDNESLIVGDIKQSIYSWRGGDWRILNDLRNKEELSLYVAPDKLDRNFRSAKRIVDFNNDFFGREYKGNVSFFGESNKSLYDDVKQDSDKDVDSEIKVALYESDANISVAADYILRNMVTEIERLQLECGVRPSQITILVRKKTEAELIAKSFCEIPIAQRKYGVCYDVVSDEALYVKSNPAVRLIIAYMRYILNPKDEISLVEAAYLYHLESLVVEGKDFDGNISKVDIVKALNDAVDARIISGKQSFEVVDILIDKLKLNEIEANVPFLIAFRNAVHNFSQKSTDVRAFIENWDERLKEVTITLPENQDAIKILTVHKSKGLEADYLFVPYCDWNFVTKDFRTTDYLFFTPKDHPELLIPVERDDKLLYTSFKDDYMREMCKLRIESYNLMYVAFTRAKYGLYVSAFRKTKPSDDKGMENKSNSKTEPKDVSYFLWEYFSEKREGWDCCINEDGRFCVKTFISGSLPVDAHSQAIDNKGYLLKKYPVCEDPESGFGIVHHLNENVEGEWSARVKGTKYHSIFENIVTAKDVESSVMQLYYGGEVDGATAGRLVSEISAALENDKISRWFDGGCNVYNEFNIIAPNYNDDKLKRPDRVMVFDDEVVVLDYKFGDEKHDKKYARQVLEYADLISKMKGFEGKKFSTYVWYYFRNELAEIRGLDDISIIKLT